MTALQPEVAPGRDQTPAAGPVHPGPGDAASLPIVPDVEERGLAGLACNHESIATLLASGGQWRQAYEHLRTALELHRAEAREESIRDSLTASYNRRYLDQRLVALLTDPPGPAARGCSPASQLAGLGVALVDLDWFKQVNDTFGHVLGDRVLQRVVELLCAGLPDGAFCARYGGEEFVLVLPDTDADTAIAVSEAARASVEQHPWYELAPGLRVTVSAGVAHEGPDTAGADGEQQLLRADALLYAAKQSGRNAVAYRADGRVRLAGAAAARRVVLQLQPTGS